MIPSIAMYKKQLNISLFFFFFFRYAQLNDQTVLFLTTLFSLNRLFAVSLDIKQFYLTHR